MFILNLKLLEYLVAMPLRMQNNVDSEKKSKTDVVFSYPIRMSRRIQRLQKVIQDNFQM